MQPLSRLVLVVILVTFVLTGCTASAPPGTPIALATPALPQSSPLSPTAASPTVAHSPTPFISPSPSPGPSTAPGPSPSTSPTPDRTPTGRATATKAPRVPSTIPGAAQGTACGSQTPGALNAEAAASHLGEVQTVEFQVVTTNNTGKVVYLNSHDPYQGHFYVAIFPDRWSEFPQPPETYFKGRCVTVRGKIELYRGTPQIVLRAARDIQIVP